MLDPAHLSQLVLLAFVHEPARVSLLSQLSMLLPLLLLVPPGVFYILSLRRALNRCSPVQGTMPPNQAWFLLIPLFNLIWHFFVVSSVASSLGDEFKCRNVANAPLKPGRSLGYAMCILPLLGLILFMTPIGPMLLFAAFVCWIVYWVKVAGYSQTLRLLHEAGNKAQ
jgi:hypothetical protein